MDYPNTGILGAFMKSEIKQYVDSILSTELHISEKECTMMKSNSKFGYKLNYLKFGITFAVIECCRFEAKSGLKRKYI